jgi:hypothetical protein
MQGLLLTAAASIRHTGREFLERHAGTKFGTVESL